MVQRSTASPPATGNSSSCACQLAPPDSGSPLDDTIRKRVEPALGADLGEVRVHDSAMARATASTLEAKAFTHGNHIWLGPSQSAGDVELMAHESAHVVQQTQGRASPSLVQRLPARNEEQASHDGEEVRERLQQRLDQALHGSAAQTEVEIPPATDAAAESSTAAEPSPPDPTARPALDHQLGSIDRTALDQVKDSVLPDARPRINRSEQVLPGVQQAERAVVESAAQPSDLTGEEGTPQPAGSEPAATQAGEAHRAPASGQAALQSAQQAASLAEQAFATASAEAAVPQPPAAIAPAPVHPVDAGGAALPDNPEADGLAGDLIAATQELRSAGSNLREHAAEQRGNAQVLRGNMRVIDRGIAASSGSLETAQEHLEYRRSVVEQADQALETAEQKAARVSAEAPDAVGRTAAQKERSGSMAGESRDLAAENNANTPDDPEAAENSREQGGKINQVSGDAGSIDDTLTQMNSSSTQLVEDASHAAQVNATTRAKLGSLNATLDQSSERIGQMREQNAAAQARVASFEEGPSAMASQANQLDQRGQSLVDDAIQTEERVHQIQAEYAEGMRAVPAMPPEQQEIPVQRQEEAGADATPRPINIAESLPSWLTGQEEPTLEQRAQMQAEQDERRTRELETIRTTLGARQFSELGEGERATLALRLTGQRLFGGLSNISWPTPGGVARGLGHLAAGLIDPRAPLMGVVSGINMIANSAAEWHRQPLSIESTWRLAANVATGLTIILGSITALAAVIAGLMVALSIVTLGAAAPITGPVIAFCATIMSTVGTWTFWVGIIAAELQAFMFLIDLIKASTARDADELMHGVDAMSTDAGNAGNSLLQAGMGRLAAAGGRQLQSSIAQAGGGVRFAAQLGARGPVASAVSGVRRLGAGGYARQVGGSIRSGLSQAGAYLTRTSATEGFRDLGSAVRGAFQQLRAPPEVAVTTRQGFSPNFLIGEGIDSLAAARAVTTQIRMSAFLDDILRLGVVPRAVSPSRLAEARAALRAGTATERDIEALVQQAVADARSVISVSRGEGRPLTWDIVRGCCGYGRDVSAASIGSFLEESSQSAILTRFQASEVFEVNKHGFSVITFPGDPPARYLVDPTFGQFLRPGGAVPTLTGPSAEVIRGSAAGASFARDLTQNGFVALTEENAALYARAIGVPEAESATAGARLLNGDRALTTEVVRPPGGAPLAPGEVQAPISQVLGNNPDIYDATELLARTRGYISDLQANGDPQGLLPTMRDLEHRLEQAAARGSVVQGTN